jgi:L-asparaginase
MTRMKKDSLKILVTGGTIDDLEYSNEKNAPQSHRSLVSSLLEQIKDPAKIDLEVLMQKDSKFITEKDREFISKKCKESKEDKIIITHGTMAMIETAQFLAKANFQKTIVLCGALIPANQKNADALSNLETAIMAIQSLNFGVHIAMHGKIFSSDRVKKNSNTGFFEEL